MHEMYELYFLSVSAKQLSEW